MMYIIVVQLKPSFRSALYRYLYEKKANSAFAIQIKNFTFGEFWIF